MSLWVASIASALLLPLAIWILISGVDDLLVDLAGLLAWLELRRTPEPPRRELLRHTQKRIAIFVPCWHESAVIGRMISQNRERVIYSNYDFFVGTYPNDSDTIEAIHDLEARFANVHLALSANPGPSSKADCLNWIYQSMLHYEQMRGVHFDVIVTHDAEDVIHADSLHWINWYADNFDMIQIPVLPIPTPLRDLTHGIYCDEFSEYQSRDMPARQWMGSFVPSNGVGTGFRRSALEALARSENNRVFEPACLTEDYENGLRLRLRNARQIFVRARGTQVATREYFPRTFRAAVRQRTRWITGIVLQTWERHRWTGSLAVRYWLLRDRKGIIGNPASLLANLLLVYGLIRPEKRFLQELQHFAPLLVCTTAIGLYRIAFRCWCMGRRFGWKMATGVPFRMVIANCINTLATARAVRDYTVARIRHRPLTWSKTDHDYPVADEIAQEQVPFIDLLIRNGYITGDQAAEALATRREGQKIGARLRQLGYLTEQDLYEALGLQMRLPHSPVALEDIRPHVARVLPKRVLRDLTVLPIRIYDGKLLLATPDVPTQTMCDQLRNFTRLEIRFHLVTPEAFRKLSSELA